MPTLKDWKDVAAGDIAARNRIWVEYQKLVTYAARNLYPTLPRHIEMDDLESAGQIGLKDAIEKFDPDKGFRFETYASPRIKGAMIDSLRKSDWVPRLVRSRNKKVELATNDLSQQLGRSPTVEEVASYTDLTDIEVHKAYASINEVRVKNIDSPLDNDSDGEYRLESILSNDIGDLSDQVASKLGIESMSSVIGGLKQREQLTLVLHYLMGYTLAEIGNEFGVTESRVCQIHTKALRSVREKMMDGK